MPHYQVVQEHGLYFVTFSVVEWLPVFVAGNYSPRGACQSPIGWIDRRA